MYTAVAILAASYLYPYACVLAHRGDEGISLLNAARVLQGQIPARDFVEVIGPGDFYWLALFFKLFGTSIGTAHIELLLVGVAISVLTFHLARRAGADVVFSLLLVTAISIPVFAINSYHWDSNLFALLSVAALVEWQKSSRSWLLSVSGLFAACTTLIMQQKGALLCGALLFSAALIQRSKWKQSFLGLLVPYAAILTAVGAFYAANHALRDALWANFFWPVFHYTNVAKCSYAFSLGARFDGLIEAFGGAVPPFVAAIMASFLLLPVLIAVALPGALLLGLAFGRRKVLLPHLIPFWLCGFALWISELQRPDLIHLVFGSPVLLVLLAVLLRMHSQARQFARIAIIATVIFAGIRLSAPLSAHVKLETKRGSIYSEVQDRALEFLQQHTRSGDEVFVYPYYPLYNFLSDTRNPTRFSYFIYGWHEPGHFTEAVEDLEAKHVKYALWDTVVSAETMGEQFPYYRVPPPNQQVIERYLQAHYDQVAFENGWRIMQRNR